MKGHGLLKDPGGGASADAPAIDRLVDLMDTAGVPLLFGLIPTFVS